MGKRDQRRRRKKMQKKELANPALGAAAVEGRRRQRAVDEKNLQDELCSTEASTGNIDATFEENQDVLSETSQSEQVPAAPQQA